MAKSKIIRDLANGEVDTIVTLKRAKVLVSDLNNDEISKWLDYEIAGYPAEAEIPSYRKTQGSLKGSYFKGSMVNHMIWTDVSIPLGKMPIKKQKELLCVEFRESVDALKELRDSGKQLAAEISADFFPAIAGYNDDPYMMITTARVVVAKHIISNIFSTVENKLLDVLLLLEKEFGSLDELDIDAKSKSEEEIRDINNRILVLVYNDNSISIGDGNKIKDSTIASKVE